MNSGREPGPEEPRASRPPPDVPPGEEEYTDWVTWRQGAGRSQPTPPDSDPEIPTEPVPLPRRDHGAYTRPDSGPPRSGESWPGPGQSGEPWPGPGRSAESSPVLAGPRESWPGPGRSGGPWSGSGDSGLAAGQPGQPGGAPVQDREAGRARCRHPGRRALHPRLRPGLAVAGGTAGRGRTAPPGRTACTGRSAAPGRMACHGRTAAPPRGTTLARRLAPTRPRGSPTGRATPRPGPPTAAATPKCSGSPGVTSRTPPRQARAATGSRRPQPTRGTVSTRWPRPPGMPRNT